MWGCTYSPSVSVREHIRHLVVLSTSLISLFNAHSIIYLKITVHLRGYIGYYWWDDALTDPFQVELV